MGEGTGFYPAGQEIETSVEKEPVRPWLTPCVEISGAEKRKEQEEEGQEKKRDDAQRVPHVIGFTCHE